MPAPGGGVRVLGRGLAQLAPRTPPNRHTRKDISSNHTPNSIGVHVSFEQRDRLLKHEGRRREKTMDSRVGAFVHVLTPVATLRRHNVLTGVYPALRLR
jgi:hypothetical protein